MIKFSELNIDIKIKNAIAEMNYVEMTPIQRNSIHHILKGFDVIASAKTGSGKTLAFLIPVIDKLLKNNYDKSKGTVAIVLSPTRELSLQIFNELEKLTVGSEISIGLVIGGNKKHEEANLLKQGISIIIATPGRLIDHMINTPDFIFSQLNTLVIDEADKLLEHGFYDDMQRIIKKLPLNRQTLLFSATLNINAAEIKEKIIKFKNQSIDKVLKPNLVTKVLQLAFICLKPDCVSVDMSCVDVVKSDEAERTMTNSQLKQFYISVKSEDKFRALYTFLKNKWKENKIIIFMSTCFQVQFYTEVLKFVGIKPLYLIGKQTNKKRQMNLETFQKDTCSLLLTTNVAARGLDISGVDWVIQFDPSNDASEYVHKVGRTARAGKSGQALLILRDTELGYLKELEENTHCKIVQKKIPSSDKLANIQKSFEKFVQDDQRIFKLAKLAFSSILACYKSYQSKCLDIHQLDIKGLSVSLGLLNCPHYVLEELPEPKLTKKQRRKLEENGVGYNSDDNDYYVPNKCPTTEDYW